MIDFGDIDLTQAIVTPLDTTGDGMADSLAVDVNHDGVADMTLSDTNGDGVFDAVQTFTDTNGDGIADTAITTFDTNNDGIGDVTQISNGVDTTILRDTDHNEIFDERISLKDENMDGMPDLVEKSFDYNQDGNIDSQQITKDSDFDGNFDVSIRRYDSDGSGIMDDTTVQVDKNSDGIADSTVHERLTDIDSTGHYHTKLVDVDEDGDGVYEHSGVRMPTDNIDQRVLMDNVPNDMFASDSESVPGLGLSTFDPSKSDMDKVVGNPMSAMEKWECQGQTGRCALYSQRFVIEELTGENVDMGEFLKTAKDNGWFGENDGTATLNMNKMLDYYGVKNEMSFHNSLDDIEQSLSRGERVIVSLDADEIWYGENDNVFSPFDAEGIDSANHAVEVIGVDRSDPGNPMVILNDSGTPNGRGEMVPAGVFCDAWDDGNCQMIRCMA